MTYSPSDADEAQAGLRAFAKLVAAEILKKRAAAQADLAQVVEVKKPASEETIQSIDK